MICNRCKHVTMNISSSSTYLFHIFLFISGAFLSIFQLWKYLRSYVYVCIYYVGAGITTLMSISDGSDLYLFCRKMERTRSVREEMDGRVFISRQSRHPFPLIYNMIKVLFPICTLIWRVNNYVSRQGKV